MASTSKKTSPSNMSAKKINKKLTKKSTIGKHLLPVDSDEAKPDKQGSITGKTKSPPLPIAIGTQKRRKRNAGEKKGYVAPDPKLLLADDDPELMEMAGKSNEKELLNEEEDNPHGLMEEEEEDEINDLIIPDDAGMDELDNLSDDDL